MFISKKKVDEITENQVQIVNALKDISGVLLANKKSIDDLLDRVNALEQQEQIVDSTLFEHHEADTVLSLELSKVQAKAESLDKHLKEYLDYKKKKDGDDPFIEVMSQSFDEKAGIEMKLDWNPAMINYLKRNGYRGATDDDIIMKYVSDMFNEKANEPPRSIV